MLLSGIRGGVMALTAKLEQLQYPKDLFTKHYPILALLVVGDIMTTYVSKMIMGEHFGELGFVASRLMNTFGAAWPFWMFLAEFSIFALTAFFFSNSKGVMKFFRWKIAVKNLPAHTLLSLIANNLIMILYFTIRFGSA
jgi:hypothetical protein